jgi:D-alanine-D-alanine ligase-like ATP-grasp enzyme
MTGQKRKKTIAILRGGNKDYHRSIKNGVNILLSLAKWQDECSVLDVVIDREANWFEKGIPSDPHKVFSKADYYIDLTEHENEGHHNLANKLNVGQIFKNTFSNNIDRVNIKRLLKQLNIDSPRYEVIRSENNLEHRLKDIWTRFHTPIVIKEASHRFNMKSLLTFSFSEALSKARSILEEGGDVIVEEYVDGKYISIVSIPDYRGEDIYMPTPVEVININNKMRHVNGKTIKDKYLIEHNHEKKSLIHIDDNLKRELKRLAKEIHQSFLLDSHALIDIALTEKRSRDLKLKSKEFFIKVLDIHTFPNLFEDSRFDFTLKNSGVDVGRFILDKIESLEEDRLSY